MLVSHLMELSYENGDINIRVEPRRFPESSEKWELLQQVYEDVSRLVHLLLNRFKTRPLCTNVMCYGFSIPLKRGSVTTSRILR